MGAAEGWQPEQEARAKLAVPALQPAAPAGAAAGLPAADWQGFAAWHRAQRASSDTFGFCLSLVSLPACRGCCQLWLLPVRAGCQRCTATPAPCASLC